MSSAGAGVSAAVTAAELSPQLLDASQAVFEKDAKLKLAQNVVTRNGIASVSINIDAAAKLSHVYSTKVKTEGKATSQKSSGRCWLFAACDVMRQALMKKYDLPADFELSQNYLFFFDKLERANYFLNAMIETADEPLDGRLVQHLLTAPVNDGGQWDMIVNLVQKWGIVPKSVFGESSGATTSRPMNRMLTNKLREFAKELRTLVKSGASKEDVLAHKAAQMSLIYNIVAVSLGTPPKTFDWEYYAKGGEYNVIRELTPMSFKDLLPFSLDDYYSLINDPRNEYGKLYTVEYLGNVVGGHPIRYINADVDALKSVAKGVLAGGEPVWFGCDVGKRFVRSMGAMDTNLVDYESLYGTKPAMSKKDRLEYGESLMTHAMTFTGFNEDAAGSVERWRVSNSWGTDIGDSGYLLMTDDWFSEFMYQVVVHKDAIPPELLAVLDTEAIALSAWDPMGALA